MKYEMLEATPSYGRLEHLTKGQLFDYMGMPYMKVGKLSFSFLDQKRVLIGQETVVRRIVLESVEGDTIPQDSLSIKEGDFVLERGLNLINLTYETYSDGVSNEIRFIYSDHVSIYKFIDPVVKFRRL